MQYSLALQVMFQLFFRQCNSCQTAFCFSILGQFQCLLLSQQAFDWALTVNV